MLYRIKQNVKKSLMQYITNTTNEDAYFVCGDGASMLTVYDAFPTDPQTFKIPSMAIEIDRDMPRAQYDLGYECTRRYDCTIDLWFDNKTASDYIGSLYKEKMENELVEYRDYDLSANGGSIIGYMFAKQIEVSPMRDILPGGEGNYRSQVTFILEYNTIY